MVIDINYRINFSILTIVLSEYVYPLRHICTSFFDTRAQYRSFTHTAFDRNNHQDSSIVCSGRHTFRLSGIQAGHRYTSRIPLEFSALRLRQFVADSQSCNYALRLDWDSAPRRLDILRNSVRFPELVLYDRNYSDYFRNSPFTSGISRIFPGNYALRPEYQEYFPEITLYVRNIKNVSRKLQFTSGISTIFPGNYPLRPESIRNIPFTTGTFPESTFSDRNIPGIYDIRPEHLRNSRPTTRTHPELTFYYRNIPGIRTLRTEYPQNSRFTTGIKRLRPDSPGIIPEYTDLNRIFSGFTYYVSSLIRHGGL